MDLDDAVVGWEEDWGISGLLSLLRLMNESLVSFLPPSRSLLPTFTSRCAILAALESLSASPVRLAGQSTSVILFLFFLITSGSASNVLSGTATRSTGTVPLVAISGVSGGGGKLVSVSWPSELKMLESALAFCRRNWYIASLASRSAPPPLREGELCESCRLRCAERGSDGGVSTSWIGDGRRAGVPRERVSLEKW